MSITRMFNDPRHYGIDPESLEAERDERERMMRRRQREDDRYMRQTLAAVWAEFGEGEAPSFGGPPLPEPTPEPPSPAPEPPLPEPSPATVQRGRAPWTDDEIELLRYWADAKGTAWCAERLGRTTGSVKAKLHEMRYGPKPRKGNVKPKKRRDRMEEMISAKASEWAMATTCTRCAKMGRCGSCKVRHCDYRGRYEAYRQGYGQAIKDNRDNGNKQR